MHSGGLSGTIVYVRIRNWERSCVSRHVDLIKTTDARISSNGVVGSMEVSTSYVAFVDLKRAHGEWSLNDSIGLNDRRIA